MKTTTLHAIHIDARAKMAEFAGYDMPINYDAGVLAEHNWTRSHCGIFDVSHMGQIFIEGERATELWESLTPSYFAALPVNASKYTVLMNEQGGIIDDLIVTRLSETKFFAVINAGCKDKDIAWIQSNLPDGVSFTHLEDRALIAVQGPMSEKVVSEALEIDTSALGYMRYMDFGPCWLNRLGYTGEDGFEISMPADHAAEAWRRLSAHPDVRPVGLAARDSLRLDMGYPLYGHDITADTSPVEAGLNWIIGKTRDGYIGADTVKRHLEDGPPRIRVGVRLTEKGVAREGAEIYTASGQKIGDFTSGGFSPTLNSSIGQGYINPTFGQIGDEVLVRVRGRDIRGIIASLPFVPAKTKARAV